MFKSQTKGSYRHISFLRDSKDGTYIGQSKSMELYLCEQFKKELLGNNPMERAQVHQWINYATFEISMASNPLIEPIFFLFYYSKEEGNNTSKELKKKIEVLEKHLNGKEFIVGSDLTLADIFLFNKIRFVMMFLYREQKDGLVKLWKV